MLTTPDHGSRVRNRQGRLTPLQRRRIGHYLTGVLLLAGVLAAGAALAAFKHESWLVLVAAVLIADALCTARILLLDRVTGRCDEVSGSVTATATGGWTLPVVRRVAPQASHIRIGERWVACADPELRRCIAGATRVRCHVARRSGLVLAVTADTLIAGRPTGTTPLERLVPPYVGFGTPSHRLLGERFAPGRSWAAGSLAAIGGALLGTGTAIPRWLASMGRPVVVTAVAPPPVHAADAPELELVGRLEHPLRRRSDTRIRVEV